ncbi:MAG: response regulator [Chloroflexi bacterium CFX4]|nr:response regulator [Chloroflexi bacterium CFX4]MDL1924385.1 response regulator [Chloroflexi bacterium CFX3]
MPNERILVVDDSAPIREFIAHTVLANEGYDVLTAADGKEGLVLAQDLQPDLILTDYMMPHLNGLEMIEALHAANISAPIILMTAEGSEALAVRALRSGVYDYLIKPITADALINAVREALRRHWKDQIKERVPAHLLESNRRLEKRLRELSTLMNIGTSVTAMLDLQQVLNSVVEAAVNVSGAEEGSLMLVDEQSGELYVRAAKNFDQQTVHTLRLPVQDSLAGQVVRTGETLVVGGNDDKVKIKTKFLVKGIVYVPLRAPNKVIGVLSVDNRAEARSFEPHDVQVLSLLADFAAVAVQNARLYAEMIRERDTLDAILHDTDDYVIVVDSNDCILFCNATARNAFNITRTDFIGQPLQTVISHPEVLALFAKEALSGRGRRSEITLGGEKFLNAQLTIIESVGRAAVMQDITHLKQLDRAKSDFVAAVAHDLRSPLTAVLGYSELLVRAGTLNEQQTRFVEQITASVHSITALITELLELSRIEAGFNVDLEPVAMERIVRKAVDGLQHQKTQRGHTLTLDVAPSLPTLVGNPLRLQQMVANLVGNAIKYTPNSGNIKVSLWRDSDNIVFQVSDSGIGIPAEDQPYVFDKFFRSERAASEFDGTGLGLSIVKGVVDQHQGRIWLESREGIGTTFTVVLPLSPTNPDPDPTRPRRTGSLLTS